MTDEKTKAGSEVIFVQESIWESIVKDTYSSIVLLSYVAIGWFLDISVLQWIGALIWMIWVGTKLSGSHAKSKCSIAEARRRLDELERKKTKTRLLGL